MAEKTAAAGLTALDAAASCPICHALFDCPLLLKSCGHSYCSTCIRQNLDFQERSGQPSCPTCRKPCDSRDLLPNSALREVLDKFVAARPLLLAAAQSSAAVQIQPAVAAQHSGKHQQLQQQQQAGRKRTRQQQQQQQQRHPGGGEGKEAEEAPGGGPTRCRTRSGSAAVGQAAVGKGCTHIHVDLAGGSSSGWSEGDTSDSASSDASEASAAGSDARQSPKRQPRGPSRGYRVDPQSQQQQQRQSAGGDSDTPSGFVRCPVCSKAIPSFFINSHVDLCLAGGSHVTKSAGAAAGVATVGDRQPPVPTSVAGPFQPLAVPAKIVPSLTSEKSLRQLLRKYCLPSDGKKKELLDRYSKLRLAVEMANDKQVLVSYEQLAKRVAAQERQMAAVQLLQPVGSAAAAAATGTGASRKPAAPAAVVVAAVGGSSLTPRSGAGAAAIKPDESSIDAASIPSVGCSFEELIAVTRRRDGARRAVQTAATHEQHAQQQQQQQQSDARQQGHGQQEGNGRHQGAQQVEQQVEQQGQMEQPGHKPSLPDEAGADPHGACDAWNDLLPLSQAQQPEWEERAGKRVQACRQSRFAAAGELLEQQPPNSGEAPRPGSCGLHPAVATAAVVSEGAS